MNYEILEIDIRGDVVTVIKATSADGIELFIPTDPANSDYQAYLKSLEPEVVEEPVEEEALVEDPIPETPAA